MMRREQHMNEVVTKRKQWRRRILRQRVVSVVACLIVFCMTYALILPALANRDASAVTTETNQTVTAETPENVVSAIQTEPKEDWETIFADASLTGVWREDLVSIAESQLGYIESARNFIIAEDGETTKGYTYFGDWYGDPYGDWDAMFVSFCLNYAGIEDMPLDADPQAMVDVLDVTETEVEQALADGKKAPTDYYYTVNEYAPIAGDLVFFDTTGDGKADRVGIVTDVALDGTQVETVEGDSNNKVQNNTYDSTDSTILGYGTLPAQPITYTFKSDNLTVKVALPQGTTVPVDAVLSVKSIVSGNEGYDALAKQASEAVEGKVANLRLFDISFYTADDNTYIPVDDDAKVTITFGEPVAESKSSEVVVLHYDDEDENPVVLADTEIADQATEDAEVKFETAGFSTFAVVEVKAGYTEQGGVIPPEAEQVTYPILDYSQGEKLNGKILMIATAQTYDDKYYALTSEANGGNDRLKPYEVTRNNDNTLTVTTNSVEQMAFKFISNATTADDANDYYIQSVATGKYVQLGGDNDNSLTLVDTPQNSYYVERAGTYSYIFYIKSTNVDVANDDDEPNGRELSYDPVNNVFITYGNSVDGNSLEGNSKFRGQMVLADLYPANNNAGGLVETTVISSDDARDETNGKQPLNNRIFAINNFYDASQINNKGTSGIRNVLSTVVGQRLIAAMMQNTAANYPAEGSTYKVLDSALWKFVSVGDHTYKIGAYNYVDDSVDGYLKLDVENVTLVDMDQATPIEVLSDDVNGVVVNLHGADNAGRYLAYNYDKDYITAYGNAANQDNFILSEYIPNYEEGVTIEDVVTNLAGQKLAIISVRDTTAADYQVVKSNSSQATNDDKTVYGLLGTVLTGAKLETKSAITTLDTDQTQNIEYWTFENYDSSKGQYYIKSSQGYYLNIGEESASALQTNQAQPIQVTTKEAGGQQVVLLSVPGTNIYLNRYWGPARTTYVGWNAEEAPNDVGSYFVLVRDYGFKATVLSREELRDAAMMPGAEIIIFVRQWDETAGTYRYYAIQSDGSAEEIFLSGDDVLKEGSIMYTSTTDPTLRWDATGSPATKSAWSTDNNVNEWIDLWAASVADANKILCPNWENGGNAEGTLGEAYASITSGIDPGTWDDEANKGKPIRAQHVAGFYKVNKQVDTDNELIDANIASLIGSHLDHQNNSSTPDERRYMLQYDAAAQTFTVKAGWNGNTVGDAEMQNVQATDDIAFYVAMVDTAELNPQDVRPETDDDPTTEDTETLVGQILTREEYQNAYKEYGSDYPYIIFAQSADGNLFALDADGKAQPVYLLNGDTLEAGERIVFDPSEVAGYNADAGEYYNSNRILWDAARTAYDKYAENAPNSNGWVDLWLRNVASTKFLSPHYANGQPQITSSPLPIDGDHAPGFFYIRDDEYFKAYNSFASYLGTLTDDNQRYKVQLDSANKEFVVHNGWQTNSGNTAYFTNFLTNGNPEYVFYVAMVVDRDVTVAAGTDAQHKRVEEYDVVTPVTDNVTMYLFNYGAGIDYYGAEKNGTNYTDPNGIAEHNNLVYRFFHRTDFGGQAIDGTNEGGDNSKRQGTKFVYNAEGDALDATKNNTYKYVFKAAEFDANGTQTKPDRYEEERINGDDYVYADAYYDWPDIKYAPTLGANGYPMVLQPNLKQHSHVDDLKYNSWKKFATNDENNAFSLEYLFNPTAGAFVETPTNDYNNDGQLTIHQTTMPGKNYEGIDANNGTDISTANGTTPKATEDDSTVENPNYALRSYGVGKNGVTGLFQKDKLGYYYYDSGKNAAWYNPESRQMELYNYAIIPGGSQNLQGGNFLPFNQAHSTARLVDTNEGWGENNNHPYGISDRTYQLNGVYQNDDVNMGRNAVTDLWFGMYIEFDFAMTPNGQIAVERVGTDGTTSSDYIDMIFEFAGDDDVLVYIDDVLCLDIGRIHGISTGSINFATGKIASDGPYTQTGDTTLKALFEAAGKTDLDWSGNTFVDNSRHTLKFFYLERGGNISDCYIRYNMQPIAPGHLTVEKVVNGLTEDGTYTDVNGNQVKYEGEYGFRLVNIQQSTSSGQEELASYTYRLYENGLPVMHNFDWDNDGTAESTDLWQLRLSLEKVGDTTYWHSDEFILKHNQIAEFIDITIGTTLYVQETSFKNTQAVDSNYWWKITDSTTGDVIIDSANASGQVAVIGEDDDFEVDPGMQMGTMSAQFTISNDTSVQVVCSNTLQAVTLGVKKVLNNPDGTVSDNTITEFKMTYTIIKPLPFGSTQTVPETETGTITLRNGVWYKADQKDGVWITNNEIVTERDSDFNRNAGIKVTGTPDTSEYYWISLSVPFGSIVQIEEVTANGYRVNWSYEGWGMKEDSDNTSSEYQKISAVSGNGATTNQIHLVADDNYITIYNTPGYELPATGGAGTTNLYALGVLLVIAAPLLYIGCRLKRKCERGAER